MKKYLLLLLFLLPIFVYGQIDITKRQISLDTLKGRIIKKVFIRDTLQFNNGSKIYAAYTSGTGITVSGTTISGNYVAGTGISISSNTISGNYVAGTGLSLSSNTFSGNYTAGNGISISSNTISGTYTAGTGISISSNTISGNYSAGTGITLSTSTFSHTAHTGDATGATSLTVVALRGVSISTNSPSTNQVLGYDGTYWIPTTGTGNIFSAGAGITLTTGTFSHTAHSGDATGATTLTVVALQGKSISTTAPITTNVLGFDGTYWTPVTNSYITYVAGTGIGISGTTLSATWASDSFGYFTKGFTLNYKAVYVSTLTDISGTGTLSATTATGDTTCGAVFVFNAKGKIELISKSKTGIDTVNTVNAITISDTTIAGVTNRFMIKNNSVGRRIITLKIQYKL
jgi:hypothetical protein